MSYQTSLYTIFIKQEEEYILVHGYTRAIDVVSHEVADFLRKRSFLDGYSESLPFSKETFETLN